MKQLKQIGIWMDHSNAFLLELSNGKIIQNSIASEFTHEEKVLGLVKNENVMHNKENTLISAYYKKISIVLKDFNEVILFGPTDAKIELFNLLKADHVFDEIKIETKTTDKMSNHQQHDFVKDYFNL